MIESAGIVLALLAGALLGVIFFGGLWWTVRRGLLSKRPAVWFLCSTLVRFGVVLAGLNVVAHGDWRRLLAALVGFLVSRALITHLSGAPMAKEAPIAEGRVP